MAGNSQRRGAIRKEGTKKGPQVGSGGQRRRGLEGKGATPRADQRPNHKAYKIAQKAARSNQGRHKKTDDVEVVVGRNPVVECLRAGVPATALYVVLGTEADERLTESVTRAADAGIAIMEVQRHDLDRITSNGMHQGIALQVPPYQYTYPDDLLKSATSDSSPALLVARHRVAEPVEQGDAVGRRGFRRIEAGPVDPHEPPAEPSGRVGEIGRADAGVDEGPVAAALRHEEAIACETRARTRLRNH